MGAALPTGYQQTANKTRFSMVPNGFEWSGRFRRKPCSDRRLLRFLPVFKEWRRGESNPTPSWSNLPTVTRAHIWTPCAKSLCGEVSAIGFASTQRRTNEPTGFAESIIAVFAPTRFRDGAPAGRFHHQTGAECGPTAFALPSRPSWSARECSIWILFRFHVRSCYTHLVPVVVPRPTAGVESSSPVINTKRHTGRCRLACGSEPGRPSLAPTRGASLATGDRVGRRRGLRTGSPRPERSGGSP